MRHSMPFIEYVKMLIVLNVSTSGKGEADLECKLIFLWAQCFDNGIEVVPGSSTKDI